MNNYIEAMIEEMAFIFGMEREEVEQMFYEHKILKEEEDYEERNNA